MLMKATTKTRRENRLVISRFLYRNAGAIV